MCPSKVICKDIFLNTRLSFLSFYPFRHAYTLVPQYERAIDQVLSIQIKLVHANRGCWNTTSFPSHNWKRIHTERVKWRLPIVLFQDKAVLFIYLFVYYFSSLANAANAIVNVKDYPVLTAVTKTSNLYEYLSFGGRTPKFLETCEVLN